MGLWQTDRSRYMRGFECRWKRLLGYHAFGGLTGKYLAMPLATGRYVHAMLEKVMLRLKAGETPSPEEWQKLINIDLITTLSEFREEITASLGDFTEEIITQQLDLVVGATHGYTRIVVPFLQSNFKILEVEKEMNYRIPTQDNNKSDVVWMTRSDFVAQEIKSGVRSTHDFKTTSYWNEETGPMQWANSVQMMANAYVAETIVGAAVDQYYMHMLVKGNKKYPNLLTHAFYRPGNPPFQQEDWIPDYTRSKGYSRVRVADFRNLPEWIWTVAQDKLAPKFPLVGPYPVHWYTVNAFFSGALSEELWWRDQLQAVGDIESNWGDITFQRELDHRFPRTYQCHDFSGSKCQFYDLCHKQEGWTEPLSTKFTRRIPHHPQEGDQE